MYSKLAAEQKRFYHYLISHSLLIGLFPFFIPVYLWRIGFSLSGIALYISLTGISYCIGIWVWDRIKEMLGWRRMVLLAFALELILLVLIFTQNSNLFIFSFALATGLYNCAYWMTQRTFFIASIHTGNAGNAYGNLQIAVLFALKLGLLTGGFLLEQSGFLSIFILSSLIVALASAAAYLFKLDFSIALDVKDYRPVPLKTSFTFKDQYNARGVFIVDGIFLYLESHFWLLSLFFIANNNFTSLSLLVIVLGIIFSALFYLLKRTIDKTTTTIIYNLTLSGYALSWLLRALLPQMSQLMIVVSLVIIAFSTALFRLSFNKRFYDHALSNKHIYLVSKGYLSQVGIAVWYLIGGFALLLWQPNEVYGLSVMYLVALPMLFFYWKYRPAIQS